MHERKGAVIGDDQQLHTCCFGFLLFAAEAGPLGLCMALKLLLAGEKGVRGACESIAARVLRTDGFEVLLSRQRLCSSVSKAGVC